MLDDHYQRKVIILRHLNFLNWYDIQEQMGYSRAECFRRYNQAIKNIIDIVNKDDTQ